MYAVIRDHWRLGSRSGLTARDGGNAVGLSGTILAPLSHKTSWRSFIMDFRNHLRWSPMVLVARVGMTNGVDSAVPE